MIPLEQADKEAPRPTIFSRPTDEERVMIAYLKGMRRAVKKHGWDTLTTLKNGFGYALKSYEGRYKQHFSTSLARITKDEKGELSYHNY